MKRSAEDSGDEGKGGDVKRRRIEESSSDDDDESGDDESVESVEQLAPNREKRANAGNKMALLLESAATEDDFYKSTYEGQFLEDDADDAYQSPVESDHDVVDSDFDRSEDDEPIDDVEEERPKRKSKYREPKLNDAAKKNSLLEKNKKWVMARMGGPTVAANTVSPETQAEMLEEAKETERKNVASLKKYEQFELEKKKKREKTTGPHKLQPPYSSVIDGPQGKFLVVPSIKKFHKPVRKTPFLCCVTSRPAKYWDPVTGLPYATPAAFKVIREKYLEYLTSVKNNPAVTAYLADNT